MIAFEMVEHTIATLVSALSEYADFLVRAARKALAAVVATLLPVAPDVEDAADVERHVVSVLPTSRIVGALPGHVSAFLVAPLAGPAATRAP